jgi:hypothetical protein
MLLVAVNALVGGTLGQERTVLPLLASQTFHLDLYTGALTYILAFGLSKAAMNYFAGTLSDRYGRKPVLIAGWLAAVPVPLLLIFGPSWGWIVAANMLLGISQGLTWSTAVIMKMDLVGSRQRGLAMGFNEAAGNEDRFPAVPVRERAREVVHRRLGQAERQDVRQRACVQVEVERLGGEQGQDSAFLAKGAAHQGIDGDQQHELRQVLPQAQHRTGRTGGMGKSFVRHWLFRPGALT